MSYLVNKCLFRSPFVLTWINSLRWSVYNTDYFTRKSSNEMTEYFWGNNGKFWVYSVSRDVPLSDRGSPGFTGVLQQLAIQPMRVLSGRRKSGWRSCSITLAWLNFVLIIFRQREKLLVSVETFMPTSKIAFILVRIYLYKSKISINLYSFIK